MKILCVGGGTLGSVVPLLAVIEEWRQRESAVQVEWWGTVSGPERGLVEHNQIAFKAISAGKFRRYFSAENFKDLVRIAKGFMEATWRFGLGRPDCVLTAGSFVAVPVAWAAYFYGLPIFVHQQDVRPSLANKLMAPLAKKITVALPKSLGDFPRHKTVMTGNPVRAVFQNHPSPAEAKTSLGLNNNMPVVLFIGGGTGAEALNNFVSENKSQLTRAWQVLHLTGAKKSASEPAQNYLVSQFTNNSLTYLAAADVVVTRAGMNTLTELAALSKAAVVVPLPRSHQEDNAQYLAERNAAIVISQSELTGGKLLATLNQLSHEPERQRLAKNIHAQFMPQAAHKIVEEIISALK
jgi:UDP-N-acetylglucosamine--N-acetylmuramyl-(pentapeptide) pyrophosphoryl-undecaprenol N-acetylglucosamine transferase